MLTPCPGCGALFPLSKGPRHRYVGASAGCWELLNWIVTVGSHEDTDLIAGSRVPRNSIYNPVHRAVPPLDALFGDAYGVQHHGEDSPQAIQSVAVHLLNLHGIISGQTTRPRWPIERALRKRGVFHKLHPPPLGSMLTIRHLFLGGGVDAPVSRSQYVISVYEAWMKLHRLTVEQWYEQYVTSD